MQKQTNLYYIYQEPIFFYLCEFADPYFISTEGFTKNQTICTISDIADYRTAYHLYSADRLTELNKNFCEIKHRKK